MKHPRTTILLTTLLAAGFVIAFAWIVTMRIREVLLRGDAMKETLKLEAVSRTLEDLDTSWEHVEASIVERYEVDATLSALALRNVIERERDDAIVRYESGAVIKIEKEEVTAPEHIGEQLGLEASLFETYAKCKGLFQAPADASTLVVYSRIDDTPYYYIQWYEDTVLSGRVEEAVDFPAILQKAEASYDVSAMLVAGDEQNGHAARIIYRNDMFDAYGDLEEMGLSLETLSNEAGGVPRTMTLDGTTYQYIVGKVASLDGYVILMLRQPNLYLMALERSGFTVALLILLLTGLLITGFSLYGYVRDNALPPDMEQRYAPSHVRRIAVLYGIVGTILIAMCSMLIDSLNGLYDESAKGKERLGVLEKNMAAYADRYVTNLGEFKEIYLDYGKHIAELLDNYSELQTPDVLDDLADTISASSITLYDCEGAQTVSSGGYVGLRLGTDPSSATWEFRRLLRGTESVVQEAEMDEVTGLYEVRLGIRIQDPANDGRYGAMIISLDPSDFWYFLPDGIDMMLQNLVGSDYGIWICDPENGVILAASDQAMEGTYITELGLQESDLKGGVIKKAVSEEGRWFVTSTSLADPGILKWTDAYQNAIAFYAVSEAEMSSGMGISTLIACLLFAASYAALALIILHGYHETFFDHWRGQKKQEEAAPEGGLAALKRFLSSIRPERRGVFAMECLAGIYLSQQLPIANSDTRLAHNSLYYYIISKRWDKGLNLFALAGILLLLGEILLSLILLRLLFNICAQFVGQKGKTIFRLINSFLLYASLAMFLVKFFEFIGFSKTAILGAVGTLGLAVSLGAQNFIADIIAGLTFVFEGTFHVGDAVEIRDTTAVVKDGRVEQIGLRFIRLQDPDGNIVTIINRDVMSVINKTRSGSKYRK